ncbi:MULTISPECIES: Cys-tRNA(Pro) deacylase [Gordonia]|uniref:Cys-tRNA(Pro)/Cys-tRNA(Cys) deacylase n=1 Tax=Gordonia sputi NBRC 100414 TaxID=1089453 RepID=H5TXJ3_9ACTN|nr:MULTISPECIES: Cys-tRNA(Pro) deacylase [Gordonia]NKY95404.1 Cys-tRNA(Pro) deacylase [Gordonia sputi]OBA38195.1 aminoacyl-tRNA deacylase [Gordonia sp. 852002-51296_SCH5728562-b]OBB98969.1 aminoacyl-tRNA deacylase [Gordonia sp. 852002-50395_SCH5434458]GAB38201.1 putative aminoacyl-tRNA deacylase [Gordonia sputi NBRC 100414]
MAATPALAALSRADVPHEVHSYTHDRKSEAYGAEAVDALSSTLGVAPEQIFKTLVVALTGGPGGLAVAVVPVPHKLSLKAAAAALGASKAVMAEAKAVTRSTGYVLGGVSPLGQRTALPTVVDSSALEWDRVLCSAGKRGLEVELSPTDLVAATSAITADIAA